MSDPVTGYFFKCEHGTWIKQPDRPSVHYPASGLSYVGTLNEGQYRALVSLVETFVHKCHNKANVPDLSAGVRPVVSREALDRICDKHNVGRVTLERYRFNDVLADLGIEVQP